MTFTRSLLLSSLSLLSLAAPACNSIASIAPAYVCTSTASVACAPGSTGYQCADTVTVPTQEYPQVGECSTGANFGGADTYYCCATPPSAPSTCTPTSSVSCPNATGYACTGSDSPSWSNSSLVCSAGPPSGDSTYFCCQSPATVTSTCVVDSTIVSCGTAATGYSCAGADSPAWANFALVCGPGIATGVSTGYCCASGTVGFPDAATADSEADSAATETDSGTSETDTGTTDGTDEVGSCSLGVNTGTPACDSCLEANCCSAIVACDAPDDAGLTGGYTACENLYLCINACMLGNPDAGVPGDTPAACEETCQIDYNDTETQNAVAFVTCQTTTCATACQ